MAQGTYKRHAFSWLTDANYFDMANPASGHASHFLKSQLKSLPYPTTDFTGKTAIVTGANIGLGLEACRHFTRLGAAKVIMGCRSVEKGEAARADIESTTGRKDVVEMWQVDLGSFESVRQFCHRAEKLDRVDVLIENAAVATGDYEERDGHESTITINIISTYLMGFMLLPTLRRTATQFNVQTHLNIVSSDAHLFAKFPQRSAENIFEAFKGEANMSEDRYNTSKLLVIFIARQLATEMGPPGPVIVNTINPGFCRTQLFRNAHFPLNIIITIGLFLLGRTPEMGSRTLMSAAFAGEETHGLHMDACIVRDPSSYILTEEGQKMQKKIYAELLDILEGIEPGVTKNVS